MQDLSTYTEVDPNSKLVVTASKVDFQGMERNVDTYVYKDMGVAHFDGDFEHLLESLTDSFSTTSAFASHWMLANDIDDYWGLFSADKSFFTLNRDDTGVASTFYLIEQDTTTQYFDSYIGATGTLYYLTIERDESVGTYGTLYCYIYSNSDRTVLVDTLSITLHTSKKDFRYHYAANSLNDANALPYYGYTQNHDLQEPVVDGVITFFKRRRRP